MGVAVKSSKKKEEVKEIAVVTRHPESLVIDPEALHGVCQVSFLHTKVTIWKDEDGKIHIAEYYE